MHDDVCCRCSPGLRTGGESARMLLLMLLVLRLPAMPAKLLLVRRPLVSRPTLTGLTPRTHPPTRPRVHAPCAAVTEHLAGYVATEHGSKHAGARTEHARRERHCRRKRSAKQLRSRLRMRLCVPLRLRQRLLHCDCVHHCDFWRRAAAVGAIVAISERCVY